MIRRDRKEFTAVSFLMVKKVADLETSDRTFTCTGNEEIEKKIGRDIDRLLNILLDDFPQITDVFLIGSMGCNEGVAYLDGDRPVVVSDYDLCVVSSVSLTDQVRLHHCLNKVSKEIGSFCHAMLLTRRDLPKIKTNLNSYGLKYGSQVLYGEAKTLDLSPEMVPEQISYDGFMSTAPWQMLAAFTGFIPQEAVSAAAWRNHVVSKILFCALTIRLLAKGLHPLRGDEKIDAFLQLYPELNDDSLFKWLKTIRVDVGASECSDEIFFKVCRYYLDSFNIYAAKRFNKVFNDWPEFAGRYTKDIRWLIRRIIYRRGSVLGLIGDRRWLDPGLLLLMAARSEEGTDPVLVKEARRLVQKAMGPLPAEATFDVLAETAVKGWFDHWLLITS